ncbi:hypothetical protein Cpir12675_004850 [Ceratocystis pirilliformis]|uniref:Uncharacterized protein n=1 Tax=Ceratocystis pirilliformis TaxID=259994 RepID=A0ABR3YV66_9PEZI
MKRSSQNPSYTVSPIDRSEVKFVLPGSRQAAHNMTIVTHMNLIQTAQPFLEPAILEDKWREAQEAKNKNAKSASD